MQTAISRPLSLARRMWRWVQSRRVTYAGVYSSFEQAQRVAGETYESSKLQKPHVKAWAKTVPTLDTLPEKSLEKLVDYLAFFALPFGGGSTRLTPARVLDYGGGNGLYGRLMEELNVLAPESTWNVVDLPDVCAQQSDTGLVRFNEAPPGGGEVTHLILGAVLQILPNPLETLSDLVSKNRPAHILITHCPQHEGGNNFATISKRPGSRPFPYWIFSDEQISVLLGRDYRMFSVPTPHFYGRHKEAALTFKTFFLSRRT